MLYRVYRRTLELFPDERFKVVFARGSEVEGWLVSKNLRGGTGVAGGSMIDEENKVVSQLGKSIINNSNHLMKIIPIETYERKGKLYKKSLNSDKFKER